MPTRTKAAATKAPATRKTSANRVAKSTAKSAVEPAKTTAKPAKAAAKPAKVAAKPAKVASKAAKAAAEPTKATEKPVTKPQARTVASKKRKVEHDSSTEPETEADTRKTKKIKTKEPARAKPVAKKRKAGDETSVEPESETVAAKRSKTKAVAAQPKASKSAQLAVGNKINDRSTQVLDVYVFGEGSSGELGLGSVRINGKKPIDVRRPRLNEKLSAKTAGVLEIACGGMHAVALTRDDKVLTWGVNDQGALGRSTAWNGNLRDADKEDGSDSGSDDDDSGLNPLESTPTALSDDLFAPGTKFTQVVAGDSASFLLTEDGRVYGWGTFRSSDGILGFSEKTTIQQTPVLLPTLKNIKALAAGTNHVLALDHKGYVFAWGCGEQNQLGRRIIERNKLSSLTPQRVGLPRGKIAKIACGAYHSFALDMDGNVWGWGLNNFGEIGVEDNAGEDDAVILKPAKIESLEGQKVTSIDGGVHHSVACNAAGELFTWGRVDGYQIGFEQDQLNTDDVLFDEHGKPRILVKPTRHVGIPKVVSVSAGTDNSFAVTGDGKVYSWGFSGNYQTGQGTIEDIHTPTLIDNSAIREKKILAAYAGGQYSIVVAAAAEDAPKTNGVNGA